MKVRYKERRSKQQTLIDILKVTVEPIILTHVLYRSNLHWNELKKFTGVLIAKGLLNEINEPTGARFFQITPDGMEVLKLANKLEQILGT